MEVCIDLLAKGKNALCFSKLLLLLEQQGEEFSMQSFQLLSQLLQDKTNIQIALIKKAQQSFYQKYNYRPLEDKDIDLEKIDDDDLKIYILLSIKLAYSMLQIGQVDESKELYKELQRVAIQCEFESLQWILSRALDMIDESINLRQVQYSPVQEVGEYNNLIEVQESLNLLKQEGVLVYLIPINWFKKWQRYVQINPKEIETKSEEDIFSETTIEQLNCFRESLGIEGFAIEEEFDDTSYPGPVDGSSLVEIRWNLLIDTFSPKAYQNYVVRSDLTEGKDFVFVGHQIWKLFKKHYGGFEVKRMVVANAHGNTFIDISQKIITFYPLGLKLQETLTVVMGVKENLEALTKKVKRVIQKSQEYQDYRWLKFLTIDDQEEYLNSGDTQIRAKKLEDRILFEELDFGENDILLLDFKNRDWQVTINENMSTNLSTKSQIQSTTLSKLMYDYSITDPPKFKRESRFGITGLQNLGNTCFMNSALQCLSNIYELTEYMVTNQFVQDLNLKNPIGTKGLLAVRYAELLKQMWFGKNSYVSAWDLKRVIGKFAPQFLGYGQQDAQELLSYVLDGLHEDLNKIINKPTVEDVQIKDQTDQEAANIFWKNFKKRNDSQVLDLVGGQFKSTLICPKCQRMSKNFDPFFSISLPIPTFTQVEVILYFIQSDSTQIPLKYQLSLNSEKKIYDILSIVSTQQNIPIHQLDPVMVKDHKIKERVQETDTAKWLNEHEGILFVHHVQRASQKLSINETHLLIYYMQKSQSFMSFEPKILSFVRQMVIERKGTIGELYVRIYKFARPHILNFITSCDDKQFSREYFSKFNDNDNDIYQIEFLQKIGKFPYVFKLSDQLGKNKPQEFTQNVKIYLYNQNLRIKQN